MTGRQSRIAIATLLLAPGWIGGPVEARPGGPAPRPPVRWRVQGGAGGLERTAQVRVVFVNDLPPESLRSPGGVVQVGVFLYRGQDPVAAGFVAAGAERRLPVVEAGPSLGEAVTTPAPLLVTVGPPRLVAGGVRAIGLGRAVRVELPPDPRGPSASAPRPGFVEEAGLRLDIADLEDRLRWAADTIIAPGEKRLLWEAPLPADLDRVYADYIAAGAPRSFGVPLARPGAPRLAEIRLDPAVDNLLRVRAFVDATGSFRVSMEVEAVPPEGGPPHSP
jgi:hypothetical protein